jgi:sensor histidine kinase YesM
MIKRLIDFKLLLYIAIYYALVTFVSIIKFSIYKFKGYVDHLTWDDIWLGNGLYDWISVLIYMIFINYITKKFLKKRTNKLIVLLFHLISSFLIGYFIFIVAGFIVALQISDLSHILRNTNFDHFMRVIDLNFLVYFSMLSIIYAYHYVVKIKDLENQSIKLQSQLISTKMNVLKAQLHPHFVFNTLNSISSLIEIDKKIAKNLINDFGNLYENIIESKDENSIPLEKELSFLNKYIDIISVRFSDHLTIHKKIEKEIGKILVPNMILQPLLENAIKHGYTYDITSLIIELIIKKKIKS